MKKFVRMLALLLAALLLLTACASQKQTEQTSDSTAFVPKLDTQKAVTLDAAVFFGNFEAFDQVINHFNDFYPNVTVSYNQTGDTSSDSYLEDNPSVDIFMTSPDRGYPKQSCVDLLEAGVDFRDVADGMLESNTVDGKVLSLPMGLTVKGVVVNKSLLAKEGLEVPQTWPDFLNALEMLKQKGYTPIQGPTTAVGNLGYEMVMAMLGSDEALRQAVTAGDAAGAAKLKDAFQRLAELREKGYLSQELNETYPENNYEEAILKFLEGDVPFWVCDTEKVSGMKKRESKSEAFAANPFEYEFVYAPMGDDGVYEYIEPWYGFAVNKNSDVADYAVEFLRFMARQEELNTLASVKGVPSIAKVSEDARYLSLSTVEKVECSVANDGSVPTYMGTAAIQAANELLSGESKDADEALTAFLNACAQLGKL